MKNWINRIGIGNRILSGVIAAVIAATLGAIITVHQLAGKNRVAELRHNMSSLLAQADTMIENMDAMHRGNAFDQPHLIAQARELGNGRPLREFYEQTGLYRTIPVVAAWLAVAESAKQEGYEFFTPSRPGVVARNPKNANGRQFAAAFDAFAQGQTEYFAEDRKTGELILARAVHLNKSCLSCHGDPATSPTRDGKDIVGFPMEGAQLGELKGAFILRAKMKGDPVVQRTVWSMAVVGLIILVAVVVAFYLMNQRLLVRPLRDIVRELSHGAEHTGTATEQLTRASQTLADSASEQAASLEETSSALEEIAAMTKRNAEYGGSATELGRKTRQSAGVGLERLADMSRTLHRIKQAVGEMQTSVQDIQASSQEVSKIIKTIDEIAFQTNLLALNAAVEAARAGEAGAGFAVVADEVRSLAQRSAQAARDTAERIEGAVRRSEAGGAASDKVVQSLAELTSSAQTIEQVFTGIVTQINSLDEVISQIAAANREQSEGVSEVSTAVVSLDRTTQSNAASAEENSSVAAELNAQVESVQHVVVQLETLVSGRSQVPAESKRAPGIANPARVVPRQTRAANPGEIAIPRAAFSDVAAAPPVEVNAEHPVNSF